MRLTTVILIASLMQVSAATFGQRITFNRPDVSLNTVLQEIRRQTGYDLYYDGNLISEKQRVNIVLNNATLVEALEKALRGFELNYEIEGKTVSIRKKSPPSFLENIIAKFQDIDVRGRIMDKEGRPIVGATVRIKGTSKVIQSGAEGYFHLPNVPENSELEVSFVGYTSKIVKAEVNAGIIVLEMADNDLKEIVINTGYQSLKKEKMTGATVTVASGELEKRYTPNILDNLEGRIPGLVNYRGTTTIRGVSTFDSGARNPLVVVDGLPIEGSLANVNPYDVESVTVLKDAAAASIYGIRASNGVIVVTTKKAKERRTAIEFATDVTLTDKVNYNKFNYLTAAQQVDIESTWAARTLLDPTNGANAVASLTTQINNGNIVTPITYDYYQLANKQITQAQLDERLNGYRQNDFRQQFRDNALLGQLLQQYNFAVRTAGDRFQSSLIVNYKTDNSGIINAYNNQLNIFYKGTYKVSKWLDIDFGVNGILGKIQSSNSGFAASGINVSPYLMLLDENGNRTKYTTTDYNAYNTLTSTTPQLQSMSFNHLDELDLDQRKTKQNFQRYFVNLKANLLPGLSFSPQFQYENNITSMRSYSEPESYIMRYIRNAYTQRAGTAPNYTYSNPIPVGGKLATSEQTSDAWTARGQFDYNKKIGKHEIALIGGAEFRESLSRGVNGLLLGYDDQLQTQATLSVNYLALSSITTSTFFKPSFNLVNLYNGNIGNQIGLIPEVKRRSNSVYGNATYTYDNKYNVFGSFRKDYADVFGLDKKYRGRPLWSVGLGWNLHNEEFLFGYNWISFLKFRATYGITGNIPPGLSSRLVANSTLAPNAVTQQPVSVVETSGNPLLRWEKTATTNLGLDFSLLANRLNGSLDWYRKVGSDIFASTRIDPSEGFISQIINNGNLLNNGFELSLQYEWLRPAKTSDLSWSTTFVLSKNNNKITYVDQVANTPQLLTVNGLKEGYPVQALFSYQYQGLNAVGQPQWLKGNGTLSTVALTTADMGAIVYSGGRDPKTNLALTNEVNYKGFSLNFLVVYYGGHFQRANVPGVYGGPTYGATQNWVLNAWTPTNTNTLIPGYGQYAPPAVLPAGHLENSDDFVRSSDFLKIRSVGLGYRLPRELAAKLGSRNVGLRFQLNNPKALWIRNDVHIDPETGSAPILTSYVFGLNFNL